MKLIINCDDFGLAYSFTEGVRTSYLDGITTSTSIRTNGPVYEYAVKLLKGELKGIGLGLHLNSTDGKTKTTYLANNKGDYKYNFFRLANPLLKRKKELRNKIEEDFGGQFEKLIADGIRPDHVDSEKHIHMIPWIFEIVCKLCREYGISYIRFSKEDYYFTNSILTNLQPFINTNLIKVFTLNTFARENYETLKKYKLKTSDGFYGILHTNNTTPMIFKSIIKDAMENRYEIVEVGIHPGIPNDSRDKIYTSHQFEKYANMPNRLTEAKTLKDNELRLFIKTKKIDLVNYRDLD